MQMGESGSFGFSLSVVRFMIVIANRREGMRLMLTGESGSFGFSLSAGRFMFVVANRREGDAYHADERNWLVQL